MFDTRTLKVTLAVVLVHALLLYLLQSGLLHRAAQKVLPMEIVAQLIQPEPPAPAPPPPMPPEPSKQAPKPKQIVAPKPESKPEPKPEPLITPTPNLAPVETAITAPPPPLPAPAPPSAPTVPVASPNLAPATPRIVGLNQLECVVPPPVYPRLSQQFNEQGTALIQVIIDESGRIASKELITSSGFSRLDKAALDAAQRIRCKPALENGQPVRVQTSQPYTFLFN